MTPEQLKQVTNEQLQALWDGLDGDYEWDGSDDLYHRVYDEMEERGLL